MRRRRTLRTYWLPWLLTLTTVVLAVLHGLLRPSLSSYDPQLAILAITAIAIIWYTAFTYESLQQLRQEHINMAATRRWRLAELAFRLNLLVGKLGYPHAARDLRNAVIWDHSSEQALFDLIPVKNYRVAEDIQSAVEGLEHLRTIATVALKRIEHLPLTEIQDILPPPEEWDATKDSVRESLARTYAWASGIPIEDLSPGIPRVD